MIPVHALIVEDNAVDVAFIRSLLGRARLLNATCDDVGYLSNALTAIGSRPYDAILLDLGLPDSVHHVDTAVEVIRAAPNTPVVVLSGREDLAIAQTALRAGAQSFIVKRVDLSSEELERVLLYAIERKRLDTQAKALTLETSARISGSLSIGLDAHLIEPHLRCVESAIASVETYLARAVPAHYEESRTILDQSGYYVAIREIRALLDVAVQRSRGTRPISRTALKALREQTRTDPPAETQMAARAAVAEAVLDWDPSIWGGADE